MTINITLREAKPEDAELLYRIYASTRESEMAQVDWSAEQKQAFLWMQFSAQDSYYRQHYEGASYMIIEADGQPAGRLYLARWAEEIRIMDIAVLPDFRNKGIGTTVLKDTLAEGQRTGKIVSIHVEQFNPARELYTRLGFAIAGQHTIYYLMKWQPFPGQE